MTDNAQQNETGWYIRALNGGTVEPTSGNKNKSEWVGSQNVEYDTSYWHPDGAPVGNELDRPIGKFGFPIIKGLVEKARSAFDSHGLNVPWFATFGNHDQLLQGTNPVVSEAIGGKKRITVPVKLKVEKLR